MELKAVAASVAAAGTLTGGGWAGHEYLHGTFAPVEQVQVLRLQVASVLDDQIAQLVAQIAFLERKGKLTPEEINQLNYLRDRVRYLRDLQKGKAK